MNVKKTKVLLIPLTLTLLFFSFGVRRVFSQNLCNSQQECNDLINQYTQKITDLQGQANTLSNQISQFNAQITLTSLKITQTQEQIDTLGGRIGELETSLGSLSKAFSERATETYKMYRSGEPVFLLLYSQNLSDAISSYHYLAKIQEADRNLLIRLQTAQNAYVDQKTQQETLAKQLADQQKQLNAQKAAKDQLLTATKNDEAKYQSLLSQAVAQKNAFSNFVASQGGASILSNQTTCDGWGCYYNQRDSQWGNNPLGSSSLSMAGYGCLVTSVSMMAKHFGHDIKPIDIANTSTAFFSPNADTALLYWQFSVNGTNITLNPQSVSQLDQLLASGPVIAGLYAGPDHFIVIKSGSNGNYIMNDPFMENGGSRSLSEKYTVGNITRLFTVSFN